MTLLEVRNGREPLVARKPRPKGFRVEAKPNGRLEAHFVKLETGYPSVKTFDDRAEAEAFVDEMFEAWQALKADPARSAQLRAHQRQWEAKRAATKAPAPQPTTTTERPEPKPGWLGKIPKPMQAERTQFGKWKAKWRVTTDGRITTQSFDTREEAQAHADAMFDAWVLAGQPGQKTGTPTSGMKSQRGSKAVVVKPAPEPVAKPAPTELPALGANVMIAGLFLDDVDGQARMMLRSNGQVWLVAVEGRTDR